MRNAPCSSDDKSNITSKEVKTRLSLRVGHLIKNQVVAEMRQMSFMLGLTLEIEKVGTGLFESYYVLEVQGLSDKVDVFLRSLQLVSE